MPALLQHCPSSQTHFEIRWVWDEHLSACFSITWEQKTKQTTEGEEWMSGENLVCCSRYSQKWDFCKSPFQSKSVPLNNKIEYPVECTALLIFSLYFLCKTISSLTIMKTNTNSLGTTIKINLNYEQISVLIKIGLSSLGFLVYRLKTENEIIF